MVVVEDGGFGPEFAAFVPDDAAFIADGRAGTARNRVVGQFEKTSLGG